MLKITHHVMQQLEKRPFVKPETFVKLVKFILEPLAAEYTHLTDGIHGQLAIVLGAYDKPVKIGKSQGDRVVVAVNMERRTIPTIFARFEHQGKPKNAAVMIDLEGNILDQ